jgi:hypothetical protein
LPWQFAGVVLHWLWNALLFCYLRLQEVDHALERIEPESLRYRRSQVRVRVDVVEHTAAAGCLEVLDASELAWLK